MSDDDDESLTSSELDEKMTVGVTRRASSYGCRVIKKNRTGQWAWSAVEQWTAVSCGFTHYVRRVGLAAL